MHVAYRGNPADRICASVLELIKVIMNGLGWQIADCDIEEYAHLETRVQSVVAGRQIPSEYMMMALQSSALNMQSTVQGGADRDRQLIDREKLIASLSDGVNDLESSLSWRLTAPLRVMYGLIVRTQRYKDLSLRESRD
jgi:hypothetical protein